ncbi:NAD(P)-dependent oxidoreductase [Falsiroseomonas sp.]|uniref:NAD-dependent epimerase/dehydratase family protein n=1 Tax=Falsiroseomonas sp. TaxID=2870721 RepID=UPI00271E084F|nr:NAD(P)-dependent oxidoreductase [Falsiroseomonas sp.]MDO9501722.1 NAD(P)-dependent oxidoreductase [Falsiroseomonas sp.]
MPHTKPILLTGASGNLGRMLTKELSAAGYTLRLTDIMPFPDALPKGASFVKADLTESLAIVRQAEGCGTILHFGGVSVEKPFEEVAGPNLHGLYHIYEAARMFGARVVFASSNHSIGFHERPQGNQGRLDADCAFRPDGYYGLSKVYGELMGRMYWDKHGVENVNIRIGSCFPKPINKRMLATWLSYADLARLITRTIEAERVGHCVVWGASKNPDSFWAEDHRDRLGWAPEDTAEDYRAEVGAIVSDDPVEERYQGGGYCSIEYSRKGGFSPRDQFEQE